MKATDPNRSVVEIESLRPRLRSDLHFTIQELGGERICVIEDRIAWRFHRVGLAEYAFLRALDGRRTVASILAQLARDGGHDAFTENEAVQMLRWLKDHHLLALESDRATRDDAATERQLIGALAWLNPLVARLPLARPDRFFTAAAAVFRWALGRFGFFVWLLVVGAGAAAVALDWTRFERGFDGILARDNWLWLLVAWAALKLLHELSHGLFCRHFGAAVREIGVIFVLFLPMGYVDASASLGLASRWRRIMVAAAGVYAEFFIAGLAALLWARTPDGLVATVAHNIVFTGTVLTLLFNANPLMRFDGYYIACDLLGLPNLATRGRTFLRSLCGWLLLGRAGGSRPRLEERDDWIVALYGLAAGLWQVAVFAALLVAASATLRGGGVFFAIMAGALWAGVPLWQMGRALVRSGGPWAGRLLAASWRLALLVAGTVALLFVPLRRDVTSPAILELAEQVTLRAECPGFVRQIHVHDGDEVAAGQLLAELENEDAAMELERTRLDLQQQELRARIAYVRHELAGFQAESAKADALRAAVAERARYLATLQIRAPFAGRVTGRQLAQLPGTFLRGGAELAQLGRAQGGELRIALDQETAAHFRPALGHELSLRLADGSVSRAQLARVEARATRELIHPALTALADGPLAVRRAETQEKEAAYELAEPHFVALATLPSAPAQVGTLARVRLRTVEGVTLWQSAQAGFARWLRRHSLGD